MHGDSDYDDLGPGWDEWVKHNVERGCDPRHMFTAMVDSGIDRKQAAQALGLTNQPLPSTAGDNTTFPYGHIPKSLLSVSQRIVAKGAPAQLHLVQDFLTAEECQRIIDKAKNKFRPSDITTAEYEPDKNYRTSQTHDFDPQDQFYQQIDRKISQLVELPLDYAEATQVQHYRRGNEFKQHTDYFEPHSLEWDTFAAENGQRTWTVTVYLNHVAEGGHTDFLRLGVSIKPQPGMAVAWNNLDEFGRGNPDTLHQGSKVTRGEKYIITKWFRDRTQY